MLEGPPKSSKLPEKPALSRRGFLKLGTAGALGYLALKKYGKNLPSFDLEFGGLDTIPQKDFEPKEYSTKEIAFDKDGKRRKFGSYLSSYTGIIGEVPDNAKIDFEFQLRKMWGAKTEKISGRNRNRVVKIGMELINDYEKKDKSYLSLEEYLSEIEKTLEETKKSVDWDVIEELKGWSYKKNPEKYPVNQQKIKLAKEICEGITAKDILAYSLTELMPTYNGEPNSQVLDFLLRNASRQYVESIPSLSGEVVSLGPYQLSEFAVQDSKEKMGGASNINRALPFYQQISKSLEGLRDNDHHKAAFLLLINNITNLFRTISDSEFQAFIKKNPTKNDLLIFIATSHNNPSEAKRGVIKWIQKKENGPLEDSYEKTSLEIYAKKTGFNSEALKSL